MLFLSQSCRNCVRSAGPSGFLWRKRRWCSCANRLSKHKHGLPFELMCACRQHWTAAPCCSQQRPGSAADALLHTLAEVSGQENRNEKETPRTMIMGADSDSVDKWRQLDEKVNQYPGFRTFKLIGSGGEDFTRSMVSKIEAVVELDPARIQARPSRSNKYISVTLKDIFVSSPEQVIEVYAAAKEDERLRFYL